MRFTQINLRFNVHKIQTIFFSLSQLDKNGWLFKYEITRLITSHTIVCVFQCLLSQEYCQRFCITCYILFDILFGVHLWGNSPIQYYFYDWRKPRKITEAPERDHRKPYFLKLKILTLRSLCILNPLLAIHDNENNFNRNALHDYNRHSSNWTRLRRIGLNKAQYLHIFMVMYIEPQLPQKP